MKFLKQLFGLHNPTADWFANIPSEMSLNLDTGRLHSAGLGQPFETLAFLGKASGQSSWNARAGFYQFDNVAVWATYTAGLVDTLSFTLDSATDMKLLGTIERRGQQFKPREWNSADKVVEALGEPYWRDDDEDETTLFYVGENCSWEIEIPRGERAHWLELSTKSTLADPGQRAAYGITKPWPPE